MAKLLSGIIFLLISSIKSELTQRLEPNDFKVNFGDEKIESWYLKNTMLTSYNKCSLDSKSNECDKLLNGCVLTLFKTATEKYKVSICDAFNTLKSSTDVEFTPNKYNDYLSKFLALNPSLKENFSLELKKCKPDLTLISAEYNLNGELLSKAEFSLEDLLICNTLSQYSNLASAPPTYLLKRCDLTLKQMLNLVDSSKIKFFEIFLKLNQTSSIQLPIRLKNDDTLYRRFFLYDTLTSKVNELDQAKYVRYAKEIKIVYDYKETLSQSRKVYLPSLEIEYSLVETESTSTSNIPIRLLAQFNVEEDKEQIVYGYVVLGVLCALSFAWASINTWSWNRRSAKFGVDLISVFKFLMFFISSIGDMFFVVLVLLTILRFFQFRAYNRITYLPSANFENMIKILGSVGFGLKLVDIMHLVLVQCSFNIFLMDWEKPSPLTKNKLLTTFAKSPQLDTNEDETSAGNVSCWRQLFLANEWNELQTYRKTNLIFQIVCVLTLLKVVNLESYAVKDCEIFLSTDFNNYKTNYSKAMRIGIASLVYLAIGLLQWLFYTVLYSRCINDKIGKFIDFCSVSNISVFILTHAQYGYYIHGRSPHGYSDKNMQEMLEALTREEMGLSAKRGLEASSDHQTFAVALTPKLSRQYSKVMYPVNQLKRLEAQEEMNKIINRKIKSFNQLNKFLIAFIEKILRDISYAVTERNCIENMFDIEFKETNSTSYFYRDDETCFTKALFFGNEPKNYIIASVALFLINKVSRSHNFNPSLCFE